MTNTATNHLTDSFLEHAEKLANGYARMWEPSGRRCPLTGKTLWTSRPATKDDIKGIRARALNSHK